MIGEEGLSRLQINIFSRQNDGIDGGGEDCSNSGGLRAMYSTVALRIYQEDRGAERSKSTPD